MRELKQAFVYSPFYQITTCKIVTTIKANFIRHMARNLNRVWNKMAEL